MDQDREREIIQLLYAIAHNTKQIALFVTWAPFVLIVLYAEEVGARVDAVIKPIWQWIAQLFR